LMASVLCGSINNSSLDIASLHNAPLLQPKTIFFQFKLIPTSQHVVSVFWTRLNG
jgi:hypothetical protein